MRLLLFIFSIFIYCSTLAAQTVTIDGIRKEYEKVRTDSSSCAKLYKKVKQLETTDNLSLGYKGAIIASMANYSKNKQEKINLFKEGKQLLEKAVAKDSTNVELRFLRMTIQTNCPKALGYHKQIASDKTYILANFDSIKNTSTRNNIKAFLLASAYLTDTEKKKLKATT
jgi:hypothetical protein